METLPLTRSPAISEGNKKDLELNFNEIGSQEWYHVIPPSGTSKKTREILDELYGSQRGF